MLSIRLKNGTGFISCKVKDLVDSVTSAVIIGVNKKWSCEC